MPMIGILRRVRLAIARGGRDRKGVSMLEFALVAFPFLLLVFGALEVGLIYWAAYELDYATASASRLIRTGQAQTGNLSQSQMVSIICGYTVILSNCTANLKLNVQNFPNFAAVTFPVATDSEGNLLPSYPYQPGGPSQVVLVTAYYEWPLLNMPMISVLSNLGNGNRLLQSSNVFMTEPYPQT